MSCSDDKDRRAADYQESPDLNKLGFFLLLFSGGLLQLEM